MDENEPLDKAAARELEEETSVKPSDVILEQASFDQQPCPCQNSHDQHVDTLSLHSGSACYCKSHLIT